MGGGKPRVLTALFLLALLPMQVLADSEAWAEFDSTAKTLTFKYGTKPNSFPSGTTAFQLHIAGIPYWSSIAASIKKVVFDASFAEARPTTCYRWFYNMAELTEIEGIGTNLNTGQCTNMAFMFYNCKKLKKITFGDIFNTAAVTDMKYMFYNCTDLADLDLSVFNTARVNNMYCMFHNCKSLVSLDLSHFNTANVTTMGSMFYGCTNLETLNLSGFDTGLVNNMQTMFYECGKLTSLDLSGFNTAQVTKMNNMFQTCSLLSTVYVSDLFSTDAVTSSTGMFVGCSSLSGAVTYNQNMTGHSMANYKTGYFKTYYKVGDTVYGLCGENLIESDLTIEDGKDFFSHVPFTATSATYTRSMSSKWGTLCLPFSFSAADNTTCAFYGLTSVTDDMVEVTRLTGIVEAGTPLFVYCTAADGNVTVSSADAAVVKSPLGGATASESFLVGTFTEAEVPDGNYVLSKDRMWLTDDLKADDKGAATAVRTKGMRAYLTSLASNAVRASSIALSAGNGTTALETIDAIADGTAEFYDMQGRRTDGLQKGLNIVRAGGVVRKVMVR